ncbi:ATP synthase subunit delta [Buchnera aphidicola (Phyllaphis fagi)]|uniref:F0F1 ATP synthase subunit delta n=1 Tax=Buchnera aphidicola TaxID=9 RepID=UPI003464B99B
MFKDITIARPYAKAIFDFSIQHKSLEIWKKNLKLFSIVSTCKEMKKFLSDIYSPVIILKVFFSICNQEMDIYAQNFIKLLATNKRLKILDSIFYCFTKFYNYYKNIIDIELISPFHFYKKQIQYIHKNLEKRLNKKINLTLQQDSSILDGIILRSDDVVIDICSLSNLKKLSNVLLS